MYVSAIIGNRGQKKKKKGGMRDFVGPILQKEIS